MCYINNETSAFNDRVSRWAVNNSSYLSSCVPTNDALSLLLQTDPNTGHSKKVNDFAQFKGAFLTASADGTVQVK